MQEPVTNIVLVGRTGNGKSATGNSILGHAMFNSALQAGGVTMECKMYRAAIQNGPIINVIDTPGLFDLSVPADYVSKEIIRCLTMAEGGIHALLFVLSVRNRITQEEESTLTTLQFIFDSKFFDYMIVVFTGGDELELNNQTLNDYLSGGCPEFLTRVLRLTGGRKVLFNNVTKDKRKKATQINELLSHVETIGENNCCIPYAHVMHRQITGEDDWIRDQMKYESRMLAAEAAIMRKNLKLEHDKNLRRMTQILEKRLRDSAAAHERVVREMGYAQSIRPPQYVPLNHPPPRNYPMYHPSPQQNRRYQQGYPVYHPPPQQNRSYPQSYPVYQPPPQQNIRYPQSYPVNQMGHMVPPLPPECNIM